MAGKILLEVVTPEKLLLSQQVDELIAPGVEGEFGVLPGHTHFLSMLKIGELRYRIGDQTNYMSVLWGFAEVTPKKVTILAEIAEKAEDIDVDRATQKVAEAEHKAVRRKSCRNCSGSTTHPRLALRPGHSTPACKAWRGSETPGPAQTCAAPCPGVAGIPHRLCRGRICLRMPDRRSRWGRGNTTDSQAPRN